MFEYIQGRLVQKTPQAAVIDVQGVGYSLDISVNTYQRLPETGQECRLWTYLYVREDTQRLYGFAHQDERSLFLELTGVSGIGPKVALGILSGGSVNEVKERILNEDVAALKRFPGIGPKTAKRIILELRESLTPVAREGEGSDGKAASSAEQEAVLALESLGYNRSRAEQAIRKIARNAQEQPSLEELIRKALQTF